MRTTAKLILGGLLLTACGGVTELGANEADPSDKCEQMADEDACNLDDDCLFATMEEEPSCYTRCPDDICRAGFACEKATVSYPGEDMGSFEGVCVRSEP